MKRWQTRAQKISELWAVPGRELNFQFGGAQERLTAGFTPPQGEELDLAGERIEFGTHQAVQPVGIDAHGSVQQPEPALIVGPSQKDDLGLGGLPRDGGGKGQANRGGLNPGGMFGAVGHHKLIGAALQGGHGGMAPPVPDFVLPEVIVAFDLGLEAGFARGHEHRHHAQAQTQMDHAPQAIRMAVGALEAGIIVELNVVRTTEAAPVGGQPTQHIGGLDRGVRPRHGQAAIERDAVENIDGRAAPNDQALDHIKGVQLGLTVEQGGQIPTGRRGRLAAARPLNLAVANQDAANGGQGGQRRDLLGAELGANRVGAVFAQGRMLLEPLTELEDATDHPPRGAVVGMRVAARSVSPVNPIQSLAVGAADSLADHGHRDAELERDLTERSAAPDCGDDEAAIAKEAVVFIGKACPAGTSKSAR